MQAAYGESLRFCIAKDAGIEARMEGVSIYLTRPIVHRRAPEQVTP